MPFAGLTKHFCIHLLHFVTVGTNLINLDHTDQIIFITADPISPLCIKSMILGLVSFAKCAAGVDDYGSWSAKSAHDWQILGSIPATSTLFLVNLLI